MKRVTEIFLTIAALALIAADPPDTSKPVPQDDPSVVATLRSRGVSVVCDRPKGSVISITLPQTDLDLPSVAPFLERLHNVRFLNAPSVASDGLLKYVRNWPMLESLDLSFSSDVTDDGLRNVRDLNHLTHLHLRATPIGDSGLNHIASLKALLWLDLSETKVTDLGMRHLTGLTSLERLDLGRTRISDKGLESLASLEKLKVLFLDSTRISDRGLPSLSCLARLTDLSLRDTDVTDVGIAKLKPLHQLQRLDLSGALASDEATKGIDGTQSLRIMGLRTKADLLKLDNPADVVALRNAGLRVDTNELRNVTGIDARKWNDSPDQWLPRLKRLHSLVVLQLPQGTTDSDLVRICQLTTLQTLVIDKAGITDAGTKDIGRLTELRELSFEYCRGLGNVTTARLVPLTKLEILNFWYSGVTDVGLKQIARLPALKKLNLWGTKLTGSGVAALRNLGCLEQLNLDCTQVSDACIADLTGLKSLSFLEINQTAITDGGVRRIRKAMPKLSLSSDHSNR